MNTIVYEPSEASHLQYGHYTTSVSPYPMYE